MSPPIYKPSITCKPMLIKSTLRSIYRLIFLGIFSLLSSFATANQQSAQEMQNDSYIGSKQCQNCHAQAFQSWQKSDHQKAMQHANKGKVLGDFTNAKLQYFDVTYRFFQENNQFFIEADSADGNLKTYRVLYTFGVDPLQQYLVELDGGRLQALPVAWNSKPKDQGGQHWFHLYPDQQIDFKDELHWTGQNQNWNFMCADCHSTNLKKGYDDKTDRFNTTWSEINVGCEACHGPGKQHLDWATSLATPINTDKKNETTGNINSALENNISADKGLTIPFSSNKNTLWIRQLEKTTAKRIPAWNGNSPEIEQCARCHSRRLTLGDDIPGSPLGDSRSVQLLEQRLYHSDGQIKDEVFEYGSFIQSRMYHEGVTCSNCHEPHNLKLRAPGAQVCATCHQPENYDSPSHSYHSPRESDFDKSSANVLNKPTAINKPATNNKQPDCLDCHMPAKNYMVVDPRRDHSFRVPRPDLSVELDTPNACQSCHQDQTDAWAANAVKGWLGRNAQGLQNYAKALHAGRIGAQDAEQQLMQVIQDKTQPAIARASALKLLPPYLTQASFSLLVSSLKDSNAQIRKAAVAATESLSVSDRLHLLPSLLNDPLKNIRVEVARLLASASLSTNTPQEQLSKADRQYHAKALEEFKQTQLFNAERPESHLNLGNLARQLNKPKNAEKTYREAIRRQTNYLPAWINLADLYRQQGDETQSLSVLQQGLAAIPNSPDLLMAQGFAHIRQKQQAQALKNFAAAVIAAPNNSRYRYIYGISLRSSGQPELGLKQLEKSRELSPTNLDALRALLDASLRDQRYKKALMYAQELRGLMPNDQRLQKLVEQLRVYSQPSK